MEVSGARDRRLASISVSWIFFRKPVVPLPVVVKYKEELGQKLGMYNINYIGQSNAKKATATTTGEHLCRHVFVKVASSFFVNLSTDGYSNNIDLHQLPIG